MSLKHAKSPQPLDGVGKLQIRFKLGVTNRHNLTKHEVTTEESLTGVSTPQSRLLG